MVTQLQPDVRAYLHGGDVKANARGYANEKIVFQLINTEQNKTFLEQVPHREFQDLSIVYKVKVTLLSVSSLERRRCLMPKKNDFKLDVVSVRLVKDAPIYSEHTFNNPADT